MTSANASDLTGSWFQDGHLVATVQDDWISWVDGPTAKLHRHDDMQISVSLDGYGEVLAQHDGKRTLSWRDGDVWVSPSPTKSAASSERQGMFRREKDARSSALPARSWQSCGGSGGAGTIDRAQGALPIERRSSAKARKHFCTSTLLPGRDCGKECVPVCLSVSEFLIKAADKMDGMHFGPNIYGKDTNDIVIRVILHETKPQLLSLELNSLETYNMMDAKLSHDLDWAMDVVCAHITRTANRGETCYGVQTQGAGPHFCPGGNPNPFNGASDMTNAQIWQWGRFAMAQVVGYAPFCRIRELAVPSIQGSHGAQVGGGNAFALNHTVRACDHKTTISFGNISRGAVPGMILSQTLPCTSGLIGGIDLYLMDGTFSAYGANKAAFMTKIFPSVRESKFGAREMLSRLVMSPTARIQAPQLIAPFEIDRYMIEGWAIDMAGRSGEQFKNVRAATAGNIYVDNFSDGVVATRSRPRSLARVSAKAMSLHGIEVKNGILYMANFTSQCCWVGLDDNAKLTGSKEHPARYSSEMAKKLHQPVHDMCLKYLDVWQSKPNKRGMRRIDAWQVAEVVAFCFWRERDIGVEVLEIQPVAPLSKLDDGDFRRSLLGGNKYNVAADVEVPSISIDFKSRNPLHFEDPVQRFGEEKSKTWWQYLSLGTSGMTSMLVLSTLLGVLADPNVMLSCDGDEVAEIFICRGKYVGRILQVATKQPGEQGVYPKMSEVPLHEWVTLRTVSGNETCIDLAAAQYGDTTRSECSGVPVKFIPAEAFKKDYAEEQRDKDIVAVYNEHFWSMMNARDVEGPGRMEEFYSVLGKSCAILGLV